MFSNADQILVDAGLNSSYTIMTATLAAGFALFAAWRMILGLGSKKLPPRGKKLPGPKGNMDGIKANDSRVHN